MKVHSNVDSLVTQVLAGEVWPPLADRHGYRVDPDGRAFFLPGMGGVTLDVHCGDPATGHAGDHVEPGLSVRHRDGRRELRAAVPQLRGQPRRGGDAVPPRARAASSSVSTPTCSSTWRARRCAT